MKYIDEYSGLNADQAVKEFLKKLDNDITTGIIRTKTEALLEFKKVDRLALNMQNEWGKIRVAIDQKLKYIKNK